MAKDGNNEGTLYQRKDGLWCALDQSKWKALNQIRQEPNRMSPLDQTDATPEINHGLTYDSTQVTLDRFVENWIQGQSAGDN